ncbi:MAG: MazG-like family protein [Nanoarchaeota archaeon]|nr:hypothetical protein [Nanoarchaeota archaeon]MBU1445410.1 hypothetical protein [Nanoarchaeota archaeon]MBU2420183.1 hypothetical protein [Nanoarchaeota archaeon]MBU2475367.1 hypothetical protein [Nanoarchaeota archaeon]
MEFKDLLKFIEVEDKRLTDFYNTYKEPEKKILGRTVKLSEELGELSNEILSHLSLQRKGKLENQKKDKLSEEFADMIITTLLVAKSMNIDIEKALEKKIKTIDGRY